MQDITIASNTQHQATARALSVGVFARRQLLRQIAPLGLGGVIFWLLFQRLETPDFRDVLNCLTRFDVAQWGGAAGFMALSFWAVGHYDAVLHRVMRTGINSTDARRAGIAAIAVSQTTGAGLLVGSLSRWRILPQLTFWQATRLSLIVAISFLCGLAVVLSVVVILFSVGIAFFAVMAWGVIGCALCACGVSFLQPRRIGPIPLPRFAPLRAMATIVILTLVDTTAAASVLFMFMPDITLPFSSFLPVFLIALAAALIAGTPGGLGPFEATLLMLLPAVPVPEFLGAIFAYRLIYFALPAVAGAGVLAVGPRRARTKMATGDGEAGTILPHNRINPALLDESHLAESQLALRPGKSLFSTASDTTFMVAETGQTLVALRDQICGTVTPETLKTLSNRARLSAKQPCVYKCNARIAVVARRTGWQVALISEEARLQPHKFRLDIAPRAGLRRKLRKAEKSGVRVVQSPSPLPLRQMIEIAQEWGDRNGPERGFSMGQFHTRHLGHQAVFLAYRDGELIGFATFHKTRHQWALDLMRYRGNAPNGTMHMLITSALSAAKCDRIPEVSLAAAPLPVSSLPLPARLLTRFYSHAGLRQFKSSFAPDWAPLYIAAPNAASLVSAAADIGASIIWPDRRGDIPDARPERITYPPPEPV